MKYHLPQHLDEPFKLILWTIDELVAFFIPTIALFLFFNSPLIGFVLGAICVFLLRRIKGDGGHYVVYSLMYWHLPPVIRFRGFPPSHLRDYIG